MQPLLSYSVQIAEQAAHGHVAAGDGLARAIRPADDKREVVVHRLGKAGADILAARDTPSFSRIASPERYPSASVSRSKTSSRSMRSHSFGSFSGVSLADGSEIVKHFSKPVDNLARVCYRPIVK